MLTLESDSAVVAVDPLAGGRIASLAVRGTELLVGPEADPMRWGCYPMVPFAGRVRRGMFRFAGKKYSLPANLGPHAIHGYGYTNKWEVVDKGTISWEFGPPWPFAGGVTQAFELTEQRLTVTMTATARVRQPLMLGWHPWFRRDVGLGALASLTFGPGQMYELDAEAIPTGRLIEPTDGPWDNCFVALAEQPTIAWGDHLCLRLSSSANHWVVFTEPEHALCIEPQTTAPDAFNRSPKIVEAGEALQATFTIAWAVSG